MGDRCKSGPGVSSIRSRRLSCLRFARTRNGSKWRLPLDQDDFLRLGLAPALVHGLVEFHFLPDIEGIRAAIYVADMHENVAAPIVSLNEAKSLFINPTHDFSSRHFVRPILWELRAGAQCASNCNLCLAAFPGIPA